MWEESQQRHNPRITRRSALGRLGSAIVGGIGLGVAGCTPAASPSPSGGSAATTAPVQAAPTSAPAAAATRTPKLGGRVASMDTAPVRTLDPHVSGGLSGSG